MGWSSSPAAPLCGSPSRRRCGGDARSTSRRRGATWMSRTRWVRAYPAARFFAGAQMVVVTAALFPWLPRLLLWPVATIVMLPTLLLFAREWRLMAAPSGAGAQPAAEIQHAAGGIGPGPQR